MQVAGAWPLEFDSSDTSTSYIQWHRASFIGKSNALKISTDQFVRSHSSRLAVLRETLFSMQAGFH